MNDLSEMVGRVRGLHDAIGEGLGARGGFVRCETCRKSQWDVTAERASDYMAHGWPTCCGLSMRWWTERQIQAGEVPA